MYGLDVLEWKGFRSSWCTHARVSEEIGFKAHRFSGKVSVEFFFVFGLNENVITKIFQYCNFLTFLEIFGILQVMQQKEIEYFSLVLKFTLYVCHFGFALLPLLTFSSLNSLNTLPLLNHNVSASMSWHLLNVTLFMMPLVAIVLLWDGISLHGRMTLPNLKKEKGK